MVEINKPAKILLFCFILILLLNIFIQRDIWFDESYSILYAEQPLSEFSNPVDVHPPAYYIVLNGWISVFGDSNQAIRSLSAIFAIGCFILLYFIWKKLFDEKSFTIFGILFILSTSIIYYATEVRMYIFGLFFCLLSFYSLLMFEKKGFKVLFILSTAILPYIHYFTAFFVMFELSYCFIMKKKETIKYWLVSFILMIPVLFYFFAQLVRIDTLGFQPTYFQSVLSTYYYAWFYSWGGTVSTINTILGLAFIIIAFFLIIIYISKAETKNEKKLSLLMLIWFILPTVLFMIINYFVMSLYHHRFFFFVSWFFILLTARAIYVLRDKKWVKIMFVLILAFAVLNFIQFHTQTDRSIRDVSGYFNEKNCSRTNVIVHESQFSNLPHIYYNELHGCYKNYLYTDLTHEQLNGIGANVVSEERILFNSSDFEVLGEVFYYIGIGEKLFDFEGYNVTPVFNKAGAEVMLVTKPIAKIVIVLG